MRILKCALTRWRQRFRSYTTSKIVSRGQVKGTGDPGFIFWGSGKFHNFVISKHPVDNTFYSFLIVMESSSCSSCGTIWTYIHVFFIYSINQKLQSFERYSNYTYASITTLLNYTNHVNTTNKGWFNCVRIIVPSLKWLNLLKYLYFVLIQNMYTVHFIICRLIRYIVLFLPRQK